jgi:hypothetical protein
MWAGLKIRGILGGVVLNKYLYEWADCKIIAEQLTPQGSHVCRKNQPHPSCLL